MNSRSSSETRGSGQKRAYGALSTLVKKEPDTSDDEVVFRDAKSHEVICIESDSEDESKSIASAHGPAHHFQPLDDAQPPRKRKCGQLAIKRSRSVQSEDSLCVTQDDIGPYGRSPSLYGVPDEDQDQEQEQDQDQDQEQAPVHIDAEPEADGGLHENDILAMMKKHQEAYENALDNKRAAIEEKEAELAKKKSEVIDLETELAVMQREYRDAAKLVEQHSKLVQ